MGSCPAAVASPRASRAASPADDDDADLRAVVAEIAAELGHVAPRRVRAGAHDADAVADVGEPHLAAARV